MTKEPVGARALGWTMPAEWEPHKRCWMAWPCRESLWAAGGGKGRDSLKAAREAISAVAHAIADFEPVTMLCSGGDLADASLVLGENISCLPASLDDSWLRDSGPSFLTGGDGGGLAGVDWRFNGWGGRYGAERDDLVARFILERAGAKRFAAPLVMEGGGLHVDGAGTVLTSRSVVLNPNRNPGIEQETAEQILCSALGARKVIWLDDGLIDDETDGHIDNLACFVAPGRVVALSEKNPDDANHPVLSANLAALRASKDAEGRDLEVVELPQPKGRKDAAGNRLALSYVNYYLANGAVILPAFDDSADDVARGVLAELFPERKCVQVPVLDVLVGGGGIHCITQQEPLPAERGAAG